MRAGVGDHDRGQIGAVLFALGLQVGQVYVAVVVALGHHHLHAHHLGAGGVGAVGAAGDEADVAVAFTPRFVVALDGQQAGVFALRARIGLQADARVAGGLAQPGAQQFVQFLVALLLVGRGEGVHVGKFGPGDGNHLAGGVELHGARAQRDHAAVQRQVFVRQCADVAQHAGFGVVGVEDGVREVAAGAAQCGRDQRLHAVFKGVEGGELLAVFGEHLPQQLDVGACRGLVQRDAQVFFKVNSQVSAHGYSAGSYGFGSGAGVQAQRVKAGLFTHGGAQLL